MNGIPNVAPIVLGLALLLAENEAKLFVMRILVFGWCVILLSPILTGDIFEMLYETPWIPTIRIVLFTGAVLGLLFKRLPRPAVGILTLIGFGAVFIPGWALL